MKKKVNRKKSFQKRQRQWRSSRSLYSKNKLSPADFFASKKFTIKGKIVLIGIAIGIVGILYFLFMSPFFAIKNVIIDHEGIVKNEEIEKVYNEYDAGFFKNNALLLPSQKIKKEIMQKVPAISSVVIEKEFPDIIKIKAVEKTPKIILQQNDKKVVVSGEGEAIFMIEQDTENIPNVPTVMVKQQKDIAIGDAVTSPKIIKFVEVLQSEFPLKTSFEIDHFEVPTLFANEVHIITKAGFKVMLTINHSVESQLINLVSVIQQEIGVENVQNKEYIDLRVGNWVYYK